jgi:hypothetical protein
MSPSIHVYIHPSIHLSNHLLWHVATHHHLFTDYLYTDHLYTDYSLFVLNETRGISDLSRISEQFVPSITVTLAYSESKVEFVDTYVLKKQLRMILLRLDAVCPSPCMLEMRVTGDI